MSDLQPPAHIVTSPDISAPDIAAPDIAATPPVAPQFDAPQLAPAVAATQTAPAGPIATTQVPVARLDLDQIEADLADVEIALARLDSGEYWRDEVTGQPLDDALLAQRPTARRAAQ